MNIDKTTGLVAVTLLRGYGVYNRGETAGFLPKTAGDLIAAGHAQPFDPNAAPVAAVVDDQAVAELAARAAALDAREAELAAREAALMTAPAEPAGRVDAGTGAPPKQGGK